MRLMWVDIVVAEAYQYPRPVTPGDAMAVAIAFATRAATTDCAVGADAESPDERNQSKEASPAWNPPNLSAIVVVNELPAETRLMTTTFAF